MSNLNGDTVMSKFAKLAAGLTADIKAIDEAVASGDLTKLDKAVLKLQGDANGMRDKVKVLAELFADEPAAPAKK